MPFVLDIASKNEKPTHDEIVEGLLTAILEERLKPGDKMPSIRELAKSLAVSPALINRSYAELAKQGYIKTVHGRGAFLSERIPYILSLTSSQAPKPETTNLRPTFSASNYGKQLLDQTFLEQTASLHASAPLIEDLPMTWWRSHLHNAVKFDDPSLTAYESDPMGYWPLRKAVADYLLRARSVKCAPEQIAVFTDIDGGTDLIVRILMRTGDAAVVENPGYEGRRTVFQLHGAEVIGVPVDQNGLQVDRLDELSNNIRLVYLLPSHHEPSGATLSLGRRHKLLAWAQQRDAFIIENDFDCEYQYGAPYLPSIQGLDGNDLVIYRYTFWKVLYPLNRLSILVLPKRLVPLVRRAQHFLGEAPLVEQKVLAEFIASGQLEKHIQRNRVIYESRRVALIQSLTKHFGKLPYVTTGMHLVVKFPDEFSGQAILKTSREAGLPLSDTKNYYYHSAPEKQEFLIGFAYLPSEAAITDAMDHFATSLKGTGRKQQQQ